MVFPKRLELRKSHEFGNFAMINFNFSPTIKQWPWQKRNSKNEYEYAQGSFREGLISLTQASRREDQATEDHMGQGDNKLNRAHFHHDAMVREPKSGQMIGRIRLDRLCFDKSIVSFQLVRGSLRSAWAKESILLVCPLNGPARYIKILAHPPEDCDIGLLRVEQGF